MSESISGVAQRVLSMYKSEAPDITVQQARRLAQAVLAVEKLCDGEEASGETCLLISVVRTALNSCGDTVK